jgi:Type II restriction endonuclease EcoO109I
MSISVDQRRSIAKIFREYANQTSGKLRSIDISDLNINPFLIRLMSNRLGLVDSESIVKWAVAQRLERGYVTAFGNTLKKVTQVFSEATVEGVDVVTVRGGKKYHVHVMSGPTAMSKGASQKLVQDIHGLKAKNPGSIPIVGICYGDDNSISAIMKREITENGNIQILAGHKFWAFISDYDECAKEVYEICKSVGQEHFANPTASTSQSEESQMERLQLDFERIYGSQDLWPKLLKLNA